MKALIKRAAKSVGYEIRRIQPTHSSENGEGAPQDEIVEGPWESYVLQMANQHYRPASLHYHGSKYGDDQRLKHIAYFLICGDCASWRPVPLRGITASCWKRWASGRISRSKAARKICRNANASNRNTGWSTPNFFWAILKITTTALRSHHSPVRSI